MGGVGCICDRTQTIKFMATRFVALHYQNESHWLLTLGASVFLSKPRKCFSGGFGWEMDKRQAEDHPKQGIV